MKCPPSYCSIYFVLLNAALLTFTFDSHGASSDDYWDSGFGTPGSSGTMATLLKTESDFYAAGDFTTIGGVQASRIARFDGTNWYPLREGLGGDVAVPQTLAYTHGSLYVGGVFSQAGTTPVSNIARWDGTNWFPCGAGVNGIVRAMTVADNKLIAGGTFTIAGGAVAHNIASWDGTNWFPIGSGISGTAIDSLAAIGPTIYAGGRFRVGSGINATNIAEWNGTTWSGLGEGIRISDQGASGGHVRALLITTNGLFAAGSFRMAGRSNAVGIARWDGTNWWPLGNGIDASGGINALAFSGTDLYVGGFFSFAGTNAANSIAKWVNSNWFSLGDGIFFQGRNGVAYGMVSDGAGLYVGGGFDHVGSTPANNIALWHIPHALSVNRAGQNVTLSWPATGSNLILETKENVADTNWSVVSTNPALLGDELRVTNQINSPSRFFRLRRK